mmetsp:Transcript_19135/g.36242  ORF Transcript_19135/g.36242 Transcript_19135/m.36242 type:complete len:265 (-) Transcript_19135:27-821(-)|eukprot:scaffold2366_cov159-Amphora_coffeaeformis.AAC.9
MPRPPSQQDSFSITPRDGGTSDGQQQSDDPTPETWVPPVWLLGDTTSSKRPHGRLFKLQMQPVPSAIRDAIQQTIQTEEPEKEEHKARILRQKLQDQKRKQLIANNRLESVREKKEQALKDVRQLREEEAKKSLEQLEESLRSNFELEQEEQDQQWRQRVNEECEEEKKRSLQELEEKERKEDEEARAAKKGKLEKTAQEEQEASATQESSKEEIEGLQKEIETLNHNRLEIVWLLKQVIKAEEKQKAKFQANPQAKPLATKQA